MRLEHDLVGGDRKMIELAAENVELKLRLGLLVLDVFLGDPLLLQ
jgi:hypothetical protein